MTTPNTQQQDAMLKRLARVEGQIRGIQAMIRRGEECEAIAQQFAAARKALDKAYQEMLAAGIAREVARMVLPVSIYSSAYVTLNARSLMNFLSLRRKAEGSTYPSYPQREIEMVAEAYEDEWARLMPLTHAAFVANGRVAP